jgi:hypothetical protein
MIIRRLSHYLYSLVIRSPVAIVLWFTFVKDGLGAAKVHFRESPNVW